MVIHSAEGQASFLPECLDQDQAELVSELGRSLLLSPSTVVFDMVIHSAEGQDICSNGTPALRTATSWSQQKPLPLFLNRHPSLRSTSEKSLML
ncbi:hypothetical protein SRHO_G00080770 [Serrasalmus rhombeus]